MSETRTGYFEGTGGVKLYYEDTGCQRRSIRDDQGLTSDHCLLSLMSAFASMMSLRMITVRASFGGFPALTRV